MLLRHWYCYMNTNHATYQSQYTELLRRCRHPRVPVKSPSSTCCRPTTFFWCGSRVDAILLFRGQQHQKAVFVACKPPAENDEGLFTLLLKSISLKSDKKSFVVFCRWLASNDARFWMLLSFKKKYGIDTWTTPKESSWSKLILS